MNSIKKKLSRYLSISVSVLLVSILLATDISVDKWISKEFDKAMVNKSNLLTTLVSEDTEEVDFDFADEIMPEFSGKNDPEYFHLWHNNKTFERSKTLDLFEINTLPKIKVALHKSKIMNVTLPDGRSGRMITIKFMPQVDSDIREEYGISVEEFSKTQTPMELTYAVSNENLNQTLWFLDLIFIISSILAVLAVRFIVYNVVEKGLKPLDKLNLEIKSINLMSDVDPISTENLPDELLPIAVGINLFISENKTLYAREKRVTSDIAHELKTPITELINLSEVAIKFPDEKQISETFTTDVLEISERLKSIVNGILLLQKSSHSTELKKSDIKIKDLIRAIIHRENKIERNVSLIISKDVETILTNEFALDTVLTNLISNALHYSEKDSQISVLVELSNDLDRIKLSISNTSVYQYSDQELAQFFEPLWQKDPSRTSSQRYGLGLAIVKSYCDNINADIGVTLSSKNQITFTVVI